MRLTYVDLCGFRGYRRPVRLEFAEGFTIIDGRNGVGKSTIFDAVEFALTGSLSKYREAKAAGETVADYLWWTGDGPPPPDRYVEVGFVDGDERFSVRRTEFAFAERPEFQDLVDRLCDRQLAPSSPVAQLCAAAIIRDEHITSLSLDLKEADRYALLRDTLGANDADEWIQRGAQLVALAKRRSDAAQQEVAIANAEVASVARRLDEVRAGLVSESTLSSAAERLQGFANTSATPDQLVGPARERIAGIAREVEQLSLLLQHWDRAENARMDLPALKERVGEAKKALGEAVKQLELHSASAAAAPSSTALALDARALISLANVGRQIGLRDGHCPLCASEQSHEDFENGIRLAEESARKLNLEAAEAEKREQGRMAAEQQVERAKEALESIKREYHRVLEFVADFDKLRATQGVVELTRDGVTARIREVTQRVELAHRDLRIIETLQLNSELERALRAESEAMVRLGRAQEKAGRARRGVVGAQALHDAARRAASETLDRRLERVLPLMAELYRRLRPHPFWNDIEYSIRGDVRRFLKLQVGDELNPQFLFSSGQRRATGLAFLLSVNLSLAWSRWKTILLDDPVQHVDDFRALHLAELAGQLVSSGRQIICAVEDEALADLLCRRIPVASPGAGKRLTLAPGDDGALSIHAERDLMPLPSNVLFSSLQPAAAG